MYLRVGVIMSSTIYATIIIVVFSLIGYLIGDEFATNRYLAVEQSWRDETERVREEYRKITVEHTGNQLLLQNELREQTKEYEILISNIKSSHAVRMLQSEKRSEILQERYKTGTIECGPIALHATRLDRTLEEGRGLVRELSTTLRQREMELNKVSTILIKDREHLNDR